MKITGGIIPTEALHQVSVKFSLDEMVPLAALWNLDEIYLL